MVAWLRGQYFVVFLLKSVIYAFINALLSQTNALS